MGPDISFINSGQEIVATDSVTLLRLKTSRRKPLAEAYWSLLLFMFVYCARPEDWIPALSSVPLAKIAGVLALAAFVLSIKRIRQHLPPEVFLTLILIGYLFLTVPMSPVWKGGAFQTTLDFSKVGLIVLVMVIAVNTEKRLRRILFVQAASVAVIAVAAIWKGQMLGDRLAGALNGNYSNPNDLALAIVISLPICAALLYLSRSWLLKAAWAVAMLVMTYAVLVTGSRGGFISLVVASAVCLWEFGLRGRRPYLFALALLVGVALWVSSGATLRQRFTAIFNSDADTDAAAYESAQQRQELFWRSVELTAQHPFWGIGPGNFQVLSGSWHETHNSYTQMSSEGGIPSVVLFVMILFRGFKNVRTTRKVARREKRFKLLAGAINASLAAFAVGCLFASDAYQFFPYFLVAYSTVLLRIAREVTSRPKTKDLGSCEIVSQGQDLKQKRHELTWT